MIDIPERPADHAEEFSHRWADRLEEYCAVRMEEIGVPPDQIGDSDPEHGIVWLAFNPRDRTGGFVAGGITVNSGALNPELLKGQKGGRHFAKARLRDRIDAIIAHEYEEGRHGSHLAALKAAAKTELTISDAARRILRAMAR